jgi:hypothetical protein
MSECSAMKIETILLNRNGRRIARYVVVHKNTKRVATGSFPNGSVQIVLQKMDKVEAKRRKRR